MPFMWPLENRWARAGNRGEIVAGIDQEFLDEQKMREFTTRRLTLQEMLRKLFRLKENETRYLQLCKGIMSARNGICVGKY